MPHSEQRDRSSRTVAPGVSERHTRTCTRSMGGRRCSCQPTYRAVISTGPRDARNRHTRTFSNLADATAWIDDTKRVHRSGEDLGSLVAVQVAVPTIRAAADAFITRMEAGQVLARGGAPYSSVTVDNYAGALARFVIPFHVERYGRPLGDLTADLVDTRILESLAEQIATAHPRINGHRASTSGNASARIAVSALRQLLADLYRRGLIDSVPPPPVTMPAPPNPRDRRLSLTEADALIRAAFADDQRLGRSLLGPFVLLCARTGARRGELRGLTWGAQGLDPADTTPTISIARDTTKTDAGVRVVALDSYTSQLMREHRHDSGNPADGSLVFCDPARPDRPVGPDLLRAAFRRIGAAANIPNAGAHLLRHSVASWAVEAGVDHVDVAARLGHTDAAFTVRTYAHPDRDRIAREPLELEWPLNEEMHERRAPNESPS